MGSLSSQIYQVVGTQKMLDRREKRMKEQLEKQKDDMGDTGRGGWPVLTDALIPYLAETFS